MIYQEVKTAMEQLNKVMADTQKRIAELENENDVFRGIIIRAEALAEEFEDDTLLSILRGEG